MLAFASFGFAGPGMREPAAADLRWTSDDLIRTPTARQPDAGRAVAGVSAAGDMRAGYLTAVLIEGVSATLRRLERPDRTVGTAVDLELILAREGRAGPQVAAGVRGLLGTADGASAPYLVLSRRWWDVDVSLGTGGGRFADLDGFARAWTGQPIAPFGGLAWRPFGPEFAFEMEYDPMGIAPSSANGTGRRGDVPVNVGLSWRPLRQLDLAVALIQGERAEMRASLLLYPPAERPHEPLPPHSSPRPGGSGRTTAERRIAQALASDGMPVAAVRVGPAETTVWVDRLPYGPPARGVGRIARVLSREAPPAVERFEIVLQPEGLDGASVSVMRRDLERAAAARGSPAEIWRNAEIGPVAEDAPTTLPRWAFALTQRTEIDPSSSGSQALARLAADLSARWRSGPWLMSGAVRLNALSRLPGEGQAAVPAVRVDEAAYADLPVALNELQGAWIASPGDGWHLRYASGILEEMFAGQSAEILYRPPGARWAGGLQADLVFKRAPGSLIHTDQAFLSTLASAYLETPDAQGHLAVHAGRYLAGDSGFTVEMARTLPRGIRLGAHATLTEATLGRRGAVFGLSLSIPLGRAGALPMDVAADVAMRPVAGDAGQRLAQSLPLYPMTSDGSYGRVVASWPRILE